MTWADKVRAALSSPGFKVANLDGIVAEVGAKTFKDRQRVKNALNDLVKRGQVIEKGETERIYMLSSTPNLKPCQRIWRALRVRPMAAKDLAQVTGLSISTVSETLRDLKAEGAVEKVGKQWRTAIDQVEPPDPAALSRARATRKRDALAALDHLGIAVAEARIKVAEALDQG